MSPCLEIYGCSKTGRCVIQDDFHDLAAQIMDSHAMMIASPIFFYAVSAHTKIFMDRCQSLWVKKHWVEGVPPGKREPVRKGLFISAGATKGKRLFDGALLSIRYFFDVFEMELWRSLLYRELESEGDVRLHPEHLLEARRAGQDLCRAVEADLRGRA
ncbi:flavodoxin family protein [Thermodesulfobacteriota bacterium]